MNSSNSVNFEDLRGTGPYEVVCARCSNRFGFAAAHPFLDEILLGVKLVPKSERRGGYSDIDGYRRSGDHPIRPTLGYAPDSPEWQQQERRRIVATGSGRFTFNCSKCGAAPVVKMPTLVRQYEAAHAKSAHHLMQI